MACYQVTDLLIECGPILKLGRVSASCKALRNHYNHAVQWSALAALIGCPHLAPVAARREVQMFCHIHSFRYLLSLVETKIVGCRQVLHRFGCMHRSLPIRHIGRRHTGYSAPLFFSWYLPRVDASIANYTGVVHPTWQRIMQLPNGGTQDLETDRPAPMIDFAIKTGAFFLGMMLVFLMSNKNVIYYVIYYFPGPPDLE